MKFLSRIIRAVLPCALVWTALAGTDARADLTAAQAHALVEQTQSGDKTSLETLMSEARKGGANAQFNLGLMYFGGLGVPRDYGQAAQWFRKAADQRLALAQSLLGFLYEKGEGVPADGRQAERWYRKAADQGNYMAQYRLGVLYEDGQGIARNYGLAARWFRKAADQGFPSAQINLGVLYAKGQGVPKDGRQAAQWFRKAANQGNVLAQSLLGALYENGQGVPQDYGQAAQWYRKAADQGDDLARVGLGDLYENGRGVPRSKVVAYALYTLSSAPESAQGNPASQKRDALVKTMTPQEIRAGQDLSRKMNLRGHLLQALDQYLAASADQHG